LVHHTLLRSVAFIWSVLHCGVHLMKYIVSLWDNVSSVQHHGVFPGLLNSEVWGRVNNVMQLRALLGLRNTRHTQIRPYANCSIKHTEFSRCKWNVVNVSLLCLQWIFSMLSFFSLLFFLSSANMHKYTYICLYVYYGSDFNLCKIQVMQNLQKRDDCITWGVSVLDFLYVQYSN
jgi:hypothetical protein